MTVLGVWNEETGVPTDGLAYYLHPPGIMQRALYDPFRAWFYLLFVVTACGLLSKTWMEVGGACARDEAKKLRDQGLTVKGSRDTALAGILARYVPTSAMLGGMGIGLLVVVGDILGALGGGLGVALGVTIAFGIYEIFAMEGMTSMQNIMQSVKN